MSKNTSIEWTHHTISLCWGCWEASPGCNNCYARSLALRYGYDVWGKGVARRTFGDEYWQQPIAWDRAARRAGERRRVFCSSMTDVFLNDPTIDRERNERLWPIIRQTPDLDWLLLTKHPERIKPNLPSDWGEGYPNVWLGTSIESEDYAWRAMMLRQIPAVVRFISAEPLLGPLNHLGLQGISWLIAGGESGHGARPMDLAWVRSLRNRCAAHGTAFFLKQLGGVRDKRGGENALLDGREHKEFPIVTVAA